MVKPTRSKCQVWLSRTWGVGFWTLMFGILSLSKSGVALEPFRRRDLLVEEWVEFSLLALVLFGIVGVHVFSRILVPKILARARTLDEDSPVTHLVLAPFYVMSFFHATRPRMVFMWTFYFVVLPCIIVSANTLPPYPFKQSLNFGIMCVFAWAAVFFVALFAQALLFDIWPAVDTGIPEVADASARRQLVEREVAKKDRFFDESGQEVAVSIADVPDLDWRGPVVGDYSAIVDDMLYDLNDHYSKPREICGMLVRSPVEAAVNLFFFLLLLGMTVAAVASPSLGQVDWIVVPFKLLHLLFHALIHVLPNFSKEEGKNYRKCPRVICGIVFGLARYAVFLIFAWRISWACLVVMFVYMGVLTPLRFAGELVKSALAMAWLGAWICSMGCTGACYMSAAGAFLNLGGSGAFYLVGLIVGYVFKPWTRETDRVTVPFHVVADVGNALWIVFSAFEPSVATDTAFCFSQVSN